MPEINFILVYAYKMYAMVNIPYEGILLRFDENVRIVAEFYCNRPSYVFNIDIKKRICSISFLAFSQT